jgi:hypothetical protein
METDDWKEAPWFKDWLKMAREKQVETGDHSESDGHKEHREGDSKPSEQREFAPPFGEWNLSLREHAMMRLPKGVLALMPPQMAKAYLNARA